MHVLPVIHHLDDDLALRQADLAFACGADGVFLISHAGLDRRIARLATRIAKEHGRANVGLNLLGQTFEEAFGTANEAGVGMLWHDAPGIRGAHAEEATLRVATQAAAGTAAPKVFASVAFKHQPREDEPGLAARTAHGLGFLATTSGPATGRPPGVGKVSVMRWSLGSGAPLAIASGMTPGNVDDYLGGPDGPLATHFLVATGVSLDEHRFDERLLRAFVTAVRTASSGTDEGTTRTR